MLLADILVFDEKFNQALIYYTQIQMRVKNSTLSQQARFKAAKTSYYKGDFDWAETQLKVLKSSTSQLTANDALELQLLISDHKGSDSLHTALKLYAKAELLSIQKKSTEELEEQLVDLLNHLPKVQREIVELRIFNDLSFKEIAESEKISINTALGRMRYALMNLRKLLEENEIVTHFA